MENLTVNNFRLKALAEKMKCFLKVLEEKIACLEDEKGDTFERYMCYIDSYVFLFLLENIKPLIKFCLVAGNQLQHEIFHTKTGIENGWDKCNIEKNPFFEQNDSENNQEKKESLEEMLIFLKKIINLKKK